MTHRIPRSHTLWGIVLACAAGVGLTLVCSGCPGELPPGLINTPKPDGGYVPPDYGSWPTPDQTLWVPNDVGAADQGAPKPDTQAPKPDSKAPTPDKGTPPPTGVGGPCPCAAGLYCIGGKCRATCPVPQDGCLVDTTCPAQQGCVKTNTAGIWVCMPATTPGGACGPNVFCPTRHVCGSVNNGASICLPICPTANQGCGTNGGTCLPAGPCNFCSTT